MKKKKIALLVLTFILFLTGCGKKSISTSKFISTLENLNYNVYDQTPMIEKAELKNTNSYVTAVSNDKNINIAFLEMDSEKSAIDNYEDVVFGLESDNSFVSIKEVKKKNYKKFTGNDEKYYYVVIRLKRTYLYAYSKIESKNLLDNVIENIGY